MTDPRLAHDIAILDWARTILERHGHGIWTDCTASCDCEAFPPARSITDYEQQEPQ